jgi:ubiquinol-cytochrome c reductase cytochrome b/c1 subunit
MKLYALIAVLLTSLFSAQAFAEGGSSEPKHPEKQSWSWEGPFGTFDRQQLQRGYQVYKEVCAACHSMHLVSFRNLSQPGGPEFSAAQAKAIAMGMQVAALDDKGEDIQRPATLADRFPSPFPNEKAARAANNNAYPPDLSVIVKARAHGIDAEGPDYVYSLLTGYSDPPSDFSLLPGLNYNPYFAGHQIAMPAPLASDGQVTWPEGNPTATKQQMAKDVVAFMTWAADPHMEDRKQLGVKVMIFLSFLSVLLFFAYKRQWKDVEH